MTRRERLMATLYGKPVDRPAVSFYEIDGSQDPNDPSPFNIFSHPSWRPLIEMARDRTDRIVSRGVQFVNTPPDPTDELRTTQTERVNGSACTTTTLRAPGRTLTQRTRRDPDVYTTWTTEHLLKDVDDLKAWLALPETPFGGQPDVEPLLEVERSLGDSGILMIDTFDPLCAIAPLFDMGTYTVVAMTEPELFQEALERAARLVLPRTQAVAKALSGRLWRIYGPEYASPPYLPPRFFREYAAHYVKLMVEAIHEYGGIVRIHSHGRLKDILDDIASTGCDALDPIEPPPQGDVELEYVRAKYGEQIALFGNLEATDIENLPTPQFEKKVRKAVREGTQGGGRGFVLMASASPYGRVLPELALRNYEKMIEGVEERSK